MFRNLSYKLFAVGLAIVFWIFVVSLKNAFSEFPQTVPIQTFNLGEKLAVAEIMEGVRITLRAESPDLLRKLGAEDFEAYVDLSELGVGQHDVPVSVTSRNPKIAINRVDPSKVTVKIEPIKERIMNLFVEVKGNPAPGYQRDDRTVQSVLTVKALGAESLLAKMERAKALVTLRGVEDHAFEEKVPVKAYGFDGQVIEGISFSPAEVEVLISLNKKEEAKQVGVRATVTGSPTGGFVKSIAVEPSVVMILGAPKGIEKISFIGTEEISLSGFSESKELIAELRLPAGVTLAEKASSSVRVKIEIEKITSEKSP